MMNNCTCCGKPLTDPISVTIGYGPICRIKLKEEEYEKERGQMNLFEGPDFEYTYKDMLLTIVDLDKGGRSVTNGMDTVLRNIRKQTPSLPVQWEDLRVVYRDSMGVWDEVVVSGTDRDMHFTFKAIGVLTLEEAVGRLNHGKRDIEEAVGRLNLGNHGVDR